MTELKIDSRPKPVVLVILDGWGVAPYSPGNAIVRARKPNFDAFTCGYYTTTLQAAGDAVGLKWGEVGNSEVGHLNIGAGKVIYQPQPRIDKSIVDGSFFSNQTLLEAMSAVKAKGARLHLLGMISDSGVHSTIEHLYALLEMAKQQSLSEVYIHGILDGRDAPYNSGLKYLERLLDKTREIGIGRVASLCGRFWAMDRNNNWTRTEQTYRALAEGQSESRFDDPIAMLKKAYDQNIFDEQFKPAVAIGPDQQPLARMAAGDVVIFFNLRADRSRQLARALSDPSFDKFDTSGTRGLILVTFTVYDATLPVGVAFPSDLVQEPLAEIISRAGLKQLHVAETEKYAHVTYFLNGGREEPYPGEERQLVPSPPVTSYEEKPEMSALEIRERVVRAIEADSFDFIAVNFANADMVGHSGNMNAVVQAIEALDLCLGNISKAVLEKGGVMFLTADHGNAESMMQPTTGEINKEHTSLPVPFIIIGEQFKRAEPLPTPPDLSQTLSGGILSDVAPTVLQVMKLAKPAEMTGRSLI